MTKWSLRHTMNRRDLLGLFRSSHRSSSTQKGVLKKRPHHWRFPVKFAKFLKTSILKSICERLLLLAPPQNNIANSSGKFGLDETLKECKISIFLNITILFDQMQPYNLYIKYKMFL